MKTISFKLEDDQLKLLEKLSTESHISKSSLIRQGILLVLRRAKEDLLSAELRREVDAIVEEDRELLKKLADA